jgi:hypothetical protein
MHHPVARSQVVGKWVGIRMADIGGNIRVRAFGRVVEQYFKDNRP